MSEFNVFIKNAFKIGVKPAVLNITENEIAILFPNKILLKKRDNYSIKIINQEQIMFNDFAVDCLPSKSLIEELKAKGYKICNEEKHCIKPKKISNTKFILLFFLFTITFQIIFLIVMNILRIYF